jgi:hypothetical protein
VQNFESIFIKLLRGQTRFKCEAMPAPPSVSVNVTESQVTADFEFKFYRYPFAFIALLYSGYGKFLKG